MRVECPPRFHKFGRSAPGGFSMTLRSSPSNGKAAATQLSTLNTQLSLLPRENIVLTGFMGSGKSAVGRLIAKRLRFQFVDTDQLIVKRAGVSISEIFAQHGEEHFRNLETAELESLDHLRQTVIATGGGVVVKERNHAILARLGFVVWLTAGEDVIFNRVSRTDKRPLLQTEDPRATIRDLLAARRPLYEKAAQFTVDTTTFSHGEAADAVIAAARSAFAWDSET